MAPKGRAITLEFDYEDLEGVLAYAGRHDYTDEELRDIAERMEEYLQGEWFDILYEHIDDYIIEDEEEQE